MKKLERSLGLGQVVIVGLSAMVGTGVFVTPGILYDVTGPLYFLSFFLGAFIVMPAAVSMAELATSMPTAGGIYVYTDRSYGPFWGTIVGLGLWLSLLFKTSFALLGFGAYFTVILSFNHMIATFIALVSLVLLNIFGASKIAKAMGGIVFVILVSLGVISSSPLASKEVISIPWYLTNGVEGFFVSLTIAVGAFAGLTKLTAIAEEVQAPERNLSKGILFSLILVVITYVFISIVLVSFLSEEQLQGNLMPLITLTKIYFGDVGSKVLSVLAMLALLSMANAGILAASRFPFAMSRDELLPKALGHVNAKTLTPSLSIFVSGLIIAFVIQFFDVAKVAKAASVFIILVFILVNITVVTLRESSVSWYKPKYRSPLYPYLQVFGVLTSLVLLFYMGQLTLFAIAFIFMASIPIYFIYGRKASRLGVVAMKGKRKDLLSEEESKEELSPEFNENYIPWYVKETVLDSIKDANVVVPLFGHEKSPETLTEMAINLSEGKGVEVVHLTEVPEQTDLNDIDDPPGLKALRRRIKVLAHEAKANVVFDAVATHDVTKSLYEVSQRTHCHLLLLEWKGRKRGQLSINNPMGWLKQHLDAEIAWFFDKGIRYFRKVLIYLKGNETDDFVLKAATILASENQTSITIVTEKKNAQNMDAQELEGEQSDLVRNMLLCRQLKTELPVSRVKCFQISNDKHASQLIDMSVDFDLLIFGKDRSTYVQRIFGSRDDYIMSRAVCSVLRVQPRLMKGVNDE